MLYRCAYGNELVTVYYKRREIIPTGIYRNGRMLMKYKDTSVFAGWVQWRM